MENKQIAIYTSKNKKIQMEVRLMDETIWLSQAQIASLFEVKIPAISKHIRNIYLDQELYKESTVSKMETVQKE